MNNQNISVLARNFNKNVEVRRIVEVAEIERGITFPATAKHKVFAKGLVGCLRTASVQKEVDWNDMLYVPKSYVKKDSKYVRDGDILISMANSLELVGKVAFIESPLMQSTFGGFISVIRTLPDKIIPKYLFYILGSPSFQGKMRSTARRSVNIANLSVATISELPIHIHSLNSQKKIVELMDNTLPRVRLAKERVEKAKMLLKKFRQSVLQSAFSGNLTKDWRNTQKVNSNWTPQNLDTIFTIRTGGTPLRKNVEYYKNGSIPWVKTGEVKNCDIYDSEEKITELAVKESNAKVFPKGTLLIAMYGEGKTRGQIGWLRIPAATNQACAALIGDELGDTTKQFAFYFLLSQYEKLRAMAVGGNQPNLNLGIIKSWAMPLPSIEEQNEVVRLLQNYFKIADRVEKKLNDIEKSCEQITSSILYSTFSTNTQFP